MREVQVLMVYLPHMPTGPISLPLHSWELLERKHPHLSASRLLQAAEEVPILPVTFTALLLVSTPMKAITVSLSLQLFYRYVTDLSRHCWKQHPGLFHPRCYLISRPHPFRQATAGQRNPASRYCT